MMKFNFRFLTKICLVSSLNTWANSQPPEGTWQAWLVALKSGAPKGLPGRPDGLALTAPLPTWVDCHLSWAMDHPTEAKKLSALSKKVILRSTTKDCEGQLETWAR